MGRMRLCSVGRSRLLSGVAMSLAAGLLLSGCGSDNGDHPSARSSESIATSSPADPELAAQLPDEMRVSGTLKVGTSAPYEPMVATDENGALTGFDVDVLKRVSDVLGLRLDIRQTRFEQILPGVANGTYDIGSRGFFDTLARERRLDMVTYFRGGNQWAQRSGESVDPNNACGHRVAAAEGTVQQSVELPAKSKACVTVGDKPITIVSTPTQADAVSAVMHRSADAVSADSVVIAMAVRRSKGSLETAGEVFDTQPYGFAVAKDSPLGEALKGAVQRVIDGGVMASIAQKWGLDGVIKTSTVNGAII